MSKLCLGLAVLLCLAAPVVAMAGDVTGSVVDESGGVLPGATVTFTGPAGTQSAVTRAEGKFTIANLAEGTYKVSVTMSGFSTATKDAVSVTAAGGDIGSFALKIAGMGETVVVSASKVESTIQNAPVTMSVITSETIQSAPGQNFGDLLRTVPGVNVIQTSARDINLTSRQGTSTLATSQLVLLDGRSIYLDFFGLVLWDLVPNNMSDIKQIEVVRGPASAVWGANALTGVVNIITKSPRESEGTSVALQGGSFNRDGGSREKDGSGESYGASLSIARAPSDKLSFRIAGGYFQSDPFSRPTGQIPVIPDPRIPNRELHRDHGRKRPAGRQRAELHRRRALPARRHGRTRAQLRERRHQAAQGRRARRPGAVGQRPADLQRGLRRDHRHRSHGHRAVQPAERFVSHVRQGRVHEERAEDHGLRQHPRRRGPEPAADRPDDAQAGGPQLQDPDLRLRDRALDGARRQPHPELRRQRAAEQLRDHAHAERREPQRVRRLPAGRVLTSTSSGSRSAGVWTSSATSTARSSRPA